MQGQTIRSANHHPKRGRPLDEQDSEPPSRVRVIHPASEVQNLKDRIAALIEDKKSLRLQCDTEIIALKREHAQNIQEHEAEIALLKERQLQGVFHERNYDIDMARLKLEHAKELADRRDEHSQEIAFLKEQHAQSVSSDMKKFNEAIETLAEKYANEVRETQTSHDHQVAAMQDKGEQELNALKDMHEHELTVLNEGHEQAVLLTRAKHDQMVNTLNQEHNKRQVELETNIGFLERRLSASQASISRTRMNCVISSLCLSR
ncbi:hypothetical protein EDD18DRAFT_1129626 [Armillaria luteobubalina]|uniref:Uncharacterized protein n=1 Tax=Armillaria luteobubalina TaxID=153913 RepID=A0AA39V073_9AGAR|nr:hypothetical protein EDD18DRAFT_1129626 [Armillaria luteobubalina]